MTTISDRLAKAQPRTETVSICLNGSLVNRHEEAAIALDQATRADDSLTLSAAVREAAAAVKAIEAQIDEETVRFVIATVSREEWADLLAANPPTKEERRAGHDHDPKRFPVAAVAACVIEPEDFTLADAQELARSKSVPPGEFNKLWVAALMLNVAGTPSPKMEAATELLRVSEASSTTPDHAGSLAAGSSAGSGEQ